MTAPRQLMADEGRFTAIWRPREQTRNMLGYTFCQSSTSDQVVEYDSSVNHFIVR